MTEVTVVVSRLGGVFGEVSVTWTTLAATRHLPILPSPVTRAVDNEDFLPASGTLNFAPGQV